MARRAKNDTKNRKCKLCGRVFVGKSKLIDHIGNVHKDSIPKGWPASRYENFLRTGKSEGKCICCGEPTGWNETTWKYHRLCKNLKCRESLAKNAKKNMVKVYGKEHLLDDPDMQRKMVYAKNTSKTYYFEDPEDPSIKYPARADSSYGMDFFEMADVFLNVDGRDIIAPSPNVYYYMYEGKKHFYIPDAYMVSINTELEFKDGGSNPNKHPKIQAVDKEKERLKDEVMYKLRDQVNYIKIVNKDYSEFFALLAKLKAEDTVYMPRWAKTQSTPIQESGNDLTVYDIPDDLLLNKNQRLGKKLYSNPVSYEELMKDLRKEVESIRTPMEYQRMEAVVNNVREYLSTISNGESDSAKQLKYEADKAIRVIDDVLLPELDTKARKMRKPIAEATIVEESLISVEDLLDPTKFQPVYVLLTKTGTVMSNIVAKYTGDPYTHSAFSFDETMTDMYSFTDVGFEHENIHTRVYKKHEATTSFSVYAMMIPTGLKNWLHTVIQMWQSSGEKFRYSLIGVAKFALNLGEDTRENAKFCSQFVGDVFKMIDNGVVNKPSYKIKPMDFAHSKKLFHIQHGRALKDYKPEKTKQILIDKIKRGVITHD